MFSSRKPTLTERAYAEERLAELGALEQDARDWSDPVSGWCIEAPWLRQPCDTSDHDWLLFQAYLYQSPASRRLPAAAEPCTAIHLRWDARVAAWDAHLDERRRLRAITRDERLYGLAHDAQALGGRELGRLLRAQRSSVDAPGTVPAALAWRLAREGAALERSLAGEHIVGYEGAAPELDLSRLTTAQLLAYREAVAVASGAQDADHDANPLPADTTS